MAYQTVYGENFLGGDWNQSPILNFHQALMIDLQPLNLMCNADEICQFWILLSIYPWI